MHDACLLALMVFIPGFLGLLVAFFIGSVERSMTNGLANRRGCSLHLVSFSGRV